MLTTLIFLPLLGALMIMLFTRGDDDSSASEARYIALLTTCVTFFASI
jgi:NADH-quinone oxidoreductase subunit M